MRGQMGAPPTSTASYAEDKVPTTDIGIGGARKLVCRRTRASVTAGTSTHSRRAFDRANAGGEACGNPCCALRA